MKLNKEFAVFFIVAFLFALMEAKGLMHIAPGDENVYYYMAKQVADGKLPYKDFFYAHPPLHIYILALIVKIFGVNFFLLKSATLLALIISSFFLYKTALALFKGRLNEKNAGIISILVIILFLTSFEVLFKATFSMGINFSLMLLMISFYLVFTKRYFLGGVFAGLAGLTRFYTLPPLFAIFIFIFIKNVQEKKIKDFSYMIAGFLITFGLVILMLAIFFGQGFVEPVFNYHLLKPKLPNQSLIVYKNVLKENWVILSAFSLSLFIKNKRKFQFFYFAAFAHLLFLLYLNAPEEFYFSIAFPFMAIIGAYSIVNAIGNIKSRYFKYSVIAAVSLLFLWNAAADTLFLEKIGFLEFSQLKELAVKVSSTDANLKLFGDDSIVPLLALITNRSIALNYIDSNEKRFTSGLTNFYQFENQLNDINLSYIMLRKNKGLHQITEFRQYAEARCRLEKEYYDIAEGVFFLYRC